MRYASARFREWAGHLDALAAAVGPDGAAGLAAWGLPAIEARLVEIACDRAAHRARHDAVFAADACGDAALDPSLLTAPYRLAWECYALFPFRESRGNSGAYWIYSPARMLRGVCAIGADASIPVLLDLFRSACNPRDGLRQVRLVIHLPGALDVFRSEAGLRALLDLAREGEPVAERHRDRLQDDWHPRAQVLAVLRGTRRDLRPRGAPEPAGRPAWRDVLRAFPREGLAAEDLALLYAALAD